ncbi:hypothetical protein MF621_004087 (plasmid) [Bacillus velezensis]|uniref:hypothetical protein n=1 Tax=Bacillus velezensis TaxID=492670 RepID=UPI0004A08488|nr:hypothetical protein [Bacillus velezensis]KDN91227.1 hypothetical protein EF87_19990 [Bacillus amyloliquefaciens]URJ76380.1 hypothetical protein MF619_004125 [Bacillus velezensis]URJ80336.1 hypothetical protein MF621_004087 [Bacillus velezensis]
MTEKNIIFKDKDILINAGDILRKDSEFYIVSKIPDECDEDTFIAPSIVPKCPRILEYGEKNINMR